LAEEADHNGIPQSSSLSESNLTSQFGAVFRAKVGRFSRFLAEKQVKVGLFCGKIALSDKLLVALNNQDLYQAGERVQVVVVLALTRGMELVSFQFLLQADNRLQQSGTGIRNIT